MFFVVYTPYTFTLEVPPAPRSSISGKVRDYLSSILTVLFHTENMILDECLNVDEDLISLIVTRPRRPGCERLHAYIFTCTHKKISSSSYDDSFTFESKSWPPIFQS